MNSDFLQDKAISRQHAVNALRKAKTCEQKRKKCGWKYVKISFNTWVLAPCDKETLLPTKEGEKIIKKQKELLNL